MKADQADNPQKHVSSINFDEEILKNLVVYTNLKQEVIATTTDKIKLALRDTEKCIQSKREWGTPLGLLLTIIATLCTADFKDAMCFSKDFWKAMFFILLLISSFWLVYTVVKLIKYWGQSNVEKIIEKIILHDDMPKHH